MNKERDLTLAGFMGAVFIIIGIIGMFIIVSSFDRAAYNELKNETYLLEEEEIQLQIMEEERTSIWVVGIGALIINVAIGTVLLTMGKIVRLLEDIRNQRNGSQAE